MSASGQVVQVLLHTANTNDSHLHVLDIPVWLRTLWRVAYFAVAGITIGIMMAFIRQPELTRGRRFWSRRLLMMGLATVLVRTVILNLERWHAPLYWEGLPVDTAWLLLASSGLWMWVRQTEHQLHPQD